MWQTWYAWGRLLTDTQRAGVVSFIARKQSYCFAQNWTSICQQSVDCCHIVIVHRGFFSAGSRWKWVPTAILLPSTFSCAFSDCLDYKSNHWQTWSSFLGQCSVCTKSLSACSLLMPTAQLMGPHSEHSVFTWLSALTLLVCVDAMCSCFLPHTDIF